MQGLATLTECRIDQTKYEFPLCAVVCAVRSSRGSRVIGLIPGEFDERGIHIGSRPEHIAADGAHPFGGAIPGELHARRAVDLGTGLGGESVGHLFLHHHQERAEVVETLQQREQNRRGHVVRQIGDQRKRCVIAEIRHVLRGDG